MYLTNPEKGYHPPFDGASREVHPGRLVSLWDMLKFSPENLLQGLRLLAIVDATFSKDRQGHELGENTFKTAIEACETLSKEVESLGLLLSAISLNSLLSYFQKNKRSDEVTNFFITEFSNRLRDELRIRAMFCILPAKAAFYDSALLFGDQVNKSFGLSAFDITEGGSAYSLGRNTASVFHCMRVLERGVNALALSFGIPEPIEGDRTWGRVLKKVKDQIDLRAKSKEKDWKIRVPLLENAYAFLVAAKNAWRDDTMHIAAKYDEQDAERIMIATRAFMQELAKLIDEKGKYLVP